MAQRRCGRRGTERLCQPAPDFVDVGVPAAARANAIATRSASSTAPARSNRSNARRMLRRSCASRSSPSPIGAPRPRLRARNTPGSTERAGARSWRRRGGWRRSAATPAPCPASKRGSASLPESVCNSDVLSSSDDTIGSRPPTDSPLQIASIPSSEAPPRTPSACRAAPARGSAHPTTTPASLGATARAGRSAAHR